MQTQTSNSALFLFWSLFLQYFNYITAMIWCMRWGTESLNMHFCQLKGYLTHPHHIGTVWDEQALDDTVSYAQQRKWIAAQLSVIAVLGSIPMSPGWPIQCFNQLNTFPHPADRHHQRAAPTPCWWLSGHWVITEWLLSGYWVVTEWLLSTYWVVIEWLLNGYWVVTEWLVSGYWVVTEWLLSGYWVVTEWLLSGYWVVTE